MGKRPDFIANVVVEVEGQEKGRWTSLGVAFKNPKSRTITVLCDAWPTGGKLLLTEYKEKEDAPKKQMDVF